MTSRLDVENAQIKLTRAAQDLAAVSALPVEVGSRVRWQHNKLIWERIGPDHWWPEDRPGIPAVDRERTLGDAWPSAHVAMFPVEVLGSRASFSYDPKVDAMDGGRLG